MSKKLLLELNGNKNGKFRAWIDKFKGEPRIAWYPSAGEDFRDLLYLHPKYSEINPASKPEPQCPDIFLHTDYFPWSTSTFLDTKNIYHDGRTTILLSYMEELPRCNLLLDSKTVDFPNGSHATGRVLFLEIAVNSHALGNFSAPLIYVFVENGAFCAKKILLQKGRISHVIHIRYGGGLGGGGKSSGIWLLNILHKLNCECYVVSGHPQRQSGDERIYKLYPELAGNEDTCNFEQIRKIPSKMWSEEGDVSWQLVQKA